MIRGKEIFLKQGNRSDHSGELAETPFAGGIHPLFDARQADDSPNSLYFRGTVGELFNLLRCRRVEDILPLDNHANDLIGAEKLLEVMVATGLRNVLDHKVIDGGTNGELWDLGT